ncbi:exo-alpha-sialidase [Aquimarina sp. AD10]|uniref:WD40/YVTN/BNR-like repeat-containing protein n=1 Tax=Aquimarina sp. AD10 TaxID=1714849 RepID=UPI000E52C503|nr:sialidase family protein [Aquimarina sp. AD10]AXT60191.1 exo-alpha-sialidase [Aquimarina sp. AD10]RKM92975.1 exo-alpha-sialidase [Aquimarina sp. AD10]
MKYTIIFILVLGSMCCTSQENNNIHDFTRVKIDMILEDSISIRALDIYNDTLIGFGYNKGYGFINLKTNYHELIEFEISEKTKNENNWITEQRAVGFNNSSFFSLGIGSPARMRKIDLITKEEKIVYTETHDKVFYDAMLFWNENEGIAMGDPTEDCLSIIITKDGGENWTKISCNDLPKTEEGEAAFAASNGNISSVGDNTWILSGGMKSRVFYSPDRGEHWEVYNTPLIQGTSTTGGYAIHFYDKDNGVIFGGDYTNPTKNLQNKAITVNGGKTWSLITQDNGPGYKSSVRYIPNSNGQKLVAIGFTGISVSNDFGKNWVELSKEGFYTLRFISNTTAIAAGKGRIARLIFD